MCESLTNELTLYEITNSLITQTIMHSNSVGVAERDKMEKL